MSPVLSVIEWQFGGLSPVLGWTLLLAIGIGGAVLIVLLYRRTLRELSRGQRITLALLRVAVLLTLLLCLANPSRVQQTQRSEKSSRILAVVVDRSASMENADNRAATRLKHALQIWKRHTDQAGEMFEKIEHYRFGAQLENSASLEEAGSFGKPGDSTHLYDALHEVLGTMPGSIVCLTDGLDTTGKDPSAVLEEAQRSAVPLYFVVGKNRNKSRDSLNIREIHTPARVLRQSGFTPGTVVEITSTRSCEMPLELWSGTRKLAETTLPIREGMNTFPWSPKISAGEPGSFPLEFRLGTGPQQEMAAATTEIVESVSMDILYYQGALQWGYPFLVSALKKDPSFRLTSILNPSLGVRVSISSPGSAAPPDLPDNVAAFKKYRLIILAHVFADQISTIQQKALLEYARSGGAVLFVAPDSEASARFSGTALEQMLPVVFEPAIAKSGEDLAAENFQNHMSQIGGANSSEDTSFAINAWRRQEAPVPLKPFVLGPGASQSAINGLFSRTGEEMPMYSEFAKVKKPKSGAEVLAIQSKTGDSGTLLARQPFGTGWTATLATDLLWRWKMSLPSKSRAVEKFWQQLILSLAPMPAQGLRLVKTSGPAILNQPITLRIEGANGTPTLIKKSLDDSSSRPLPLRETTGDDGLAWETTFLPSEEGRSEFVASDGSGNQARITVKVSTQFETGENSNLPADVEGLRRLAEATGGALIGDEPVFGKMNAFTEDLPETKRLHPLWNSQWLLGLLLGLYATELVARRFMKLL